MIIKILDNFFDYLPEVLKTEHVLKSIADQLKLLAWASSSLNYLLGDEPRWYNMIAVVINWVSWQMLAHYVLTKFNINKSWGKLE